MGPYQIVSVLFRCTGQASFVSPVNHLLVNPTRPVRLNAPVSSSLGINFSALQKDVNQNVLTEVL